MPFIITGGGPGNATRVLSMLVYETGFSYLKMGRAAAISVVLFAIALAFTLGPDADILAQRGESSDETMPT